MKNYFGHAARFCASVIAIILIIGAPWPREANAQDASANSRVSSIDARVDSPNSVSSTTPAVVSPAPDPGRIRIGPGDLLDISVFDVPELAQTVRVSDLGDATLSLIGPRHLAGLTAVEAQELIAKDLKSGNLILDPQVTVLIREYGTQGISVLGEVHHPGNYPVLGSHNVLDIISLAGGITSLAGTQATVRRRGSKQLVNVNITNDAKSTLEGDIELQPGDTLMVPRTGIIYVVGQVGRPGGFPMQNNGAMSLLQAIALAEGTQSTADLKHTRIIRKTDSGFQEASISLDRILKGHSSDLALHADDVVFVPNSAAKRMGFRLESALQAAGGAAIYAVKP